MLQAGQVQLLALRAAGVPGALRQICASMLSLLAGQEGRAPAPGAARPAPARL